MKPIRLLSLSLPSFALALGIAACSVPAGDSHEEVGSATEDIVKGCAAGHALCGFDVEFNTNICCDVGEVCFAGECQPPGQVSTGQIGVAWELVGIIYAVPGKTSNAEYGTGSHIGSTMSWNNTFKAGVDVQVQAETHFIFSGGGSYEGSFLAERIDNTTVQTSKDTSSTLGYLPYPDPIASDDINHDNDILFILTNPQYNFTQTYYPSTGQTSLQWATTTAGAGDVVALSVRQAKNPALIDPTFAAAHHLNRLTANDWANVLKTAALTTGLRPSDIPQRYANAGQCVRVQGPSGVGGPLITRTFTVDSSHISGMETGWGLDTEHTIVFTVGANLGVAKVSVGVGAKFEEEHQWTRQSEAGTTEHASVQTSTPTVGYDKSYDVYLDRAFNVFAFQARTTGCPFTGAALVSGSVTSASGAPLANAKVKVTDASGVIAETTTNERGEYVIDGLPEGPAVVEAGGRRLDVHVPRSDARVTAHVEGAER